MQVSEFISSIQGVNEFLALGKKIDLLSLTQLCKTKKELEPQWDAVTMRERQILKKFNEDLVEVKKKEDKSILEESLLVLEKEKELQALYDEEIELSIKKVSSKFLSKIDSSEEGITTTKNIDSFLMNFVNLE